MVNAPSVTRCSVAKRRMVPLIKYTVAERSILVNVPFPPVTRFGPVLPPFLLGYNGPVLKRVSLGGEKESNVN